MSALLIRLFIKDRDNVKDKNVRKKIWLPGLMYWYSP